MDPFTGPLPMELAVLLILAYPETSGGVSALIKNTKPGLDINTSIKSIKVDIGEATGWM